MTIHRSFCGKSIQLTSHNFVYIIHIFSSAIWRTSFDNQAQTLSFSFIDYGKTQSMILYAQLIVFEQSDILWHIVFGESS